EDSCTTRELSSVSGTGGARLRRVAGLGARQGTRRRDRRRESRGRPIRHTKAAPVTGRPDRSRFRPPRGAVLATVGEHQRVAADPQPRARGAVARRRPPRVGTLIRAVGRPANVFARPTATQAAVDVVPYRSTTPRQPGGARPHGRPRRARRADRLPYPDPAPRRRDRSPTTGSAPSNAHVRRGGAAATPGRRNAPRPPCPR